MSKETVSRVKVTSVVTDSLAPDSRKSAAAVSVASRMPENQRTVAKPQETGKVLLDFHPDKLVQGVILAEILASPRCRRGR